MLGSVGGLFYTGVGWAGAIGFVAGLVVAAVALALLVLRDRDPVP